MLFYSRIVTGESGRDAANISFESELGRPGCLHQTTPKMFRFSSAKSRGQARPRPQPPLQHQQQHQQQQQEQQQQQQQRSRDQPQKAGQVQTQAPLTCDKSQVSTLNQSQENNTNLAFISDELEMTETKSGQNINGFVGEYDPPVAVDSSKHSEITSDDYYTKEVDVDADYNENVSVKSSNSNIDISSSKITDQENKVDQQSFISPKMISSFQNNDGKNMRSTKENSFSKSHSIFSFKKSKKSSPKIQNTKNSSLMKAEVERGKDNPINVTDDLDPQESLQTPSVVLTPPTPSPKMSTATQSPNSSPQRHSPKQILPPGNLVKESTSNKSKNKKSPPKKKHSKPKSPKKDAKSDAKLPGKIH